MATFTLRKHLACTYDEALAQVPDALKSQGFGILTEIDVKDTLKKKIDVDFRRYKILGACNPPLAHRALSTELEIGVMLPCNGVVYEDDDGNAVVSAIDPTKTIAATGVPELEELAATVRDKLAAALALLH